MPIVEQKFFDEVFPGEEARSILKKLPAELPVEMSIQERLFLVEMVLSARPRKCLEIGVAAGGSSVLLLSTLARLGDAENGILLYSIDLNHNYYKDATKKSGFIVDEFSELKRRHKLFTGGLSCEFIEEIGENIDLVLLDTCHFLPGELLDYLMFLPYLSDNAVIILHDTNMHSTRNPANTGSWGISNNILFSAIHGKKYVMGNFVSEQQKQLYPTLPNIGAIKINAETKKYVADVINLLSVGWLFMPDQNQMEMIVKFVERKYDSDLANYLKKIIEFQIKYHPYFTKIVYKK